MGEGGGKRIYICSENERLLLVLRNSSLRSEYNFSSNYSRRICWKKARMEKLEVQKKNSRNVAVDSNATAINASVDEVRLFQHLSA